MTTNFIAGDACLARRSNPRARLAMPGTEEGGTADGMGDLLRTRDRQRAQASWAAIPAVSPITGYHPSCQARAAVPGLALRSARAAFG
ncbi:MAG: hypothetical protein ACRDNW_27290 [Trebonia sp.]